MYADGRELLVFRTFLQSVRLSKKSVIVKIGSHFNGFLFSVFCFAKTEYPELYNPRKSLLRKNFDLLRNSRPNVPHVRRRA